MLECAWCGDPDYCERTDLCGEPVLCDECYLSALEFEYGADDKKMAIPELPEGVKEGGCKKNGK